MLPTKPKIKQKQSVLIIGAKGMLGAALCDIFSSYNVLDWDKEDCDITDKISTQKKISASKPDIIINAAAFTDVDGAEKDKDSAFRVNGEAVGNLADAAANIGAVFVHYSTDYVFSGVNPIGYAENDAPGPALSRRSDSREGGPLNIYGASKLLGEENLRACALARGTALKWYLIRTSWLFGPHGKNFVKTIYGLAGNNDELRIVNNQHGKPTYTKDLAQATKEIINSTLTSGIYHVTNETMSGGITWFDFAKEIINSAHFATKIIPVSSAEFPRPARRPEFSILINSKLPPRRMWQEALREYIRLLLSGKDK